MKKKPATIAEYIEASPPAGRAHLRKLYAILKKAAPKAQEAIKWNSPMFIEPRYLFGFSAHKEHFSFAPTGETLDLFGKEFGEYATTTHFLKVRYDQPVPEALIRKIALHRVKEVAARKDDSFW